MIDQVRLHVRVGLLVAADDLEVGREDVGQNQVTEVVQQSGQVIQTQFRPMLAWHCLGQPFNHRGGVDGLLPVPGGPLRSVLGQFEGLAQRQTDCQVDDQIEPQHAANGIFHRADLAGRRIER